MANLKLSTDSAAAWALRNCVLEEGELAFEGDTGKAKLGDGESTYNDLEYFDPAHGGSPKLYRALLTQTGTAAPVATVLANTLGGPVVWAYGWNRPIYRYIDRSISRWQDVSTIGRYCHCTGWNNYCGGNCVLSSR